MSLLAFDICGPIFIASESLSSVIEKELYLYSSLPKDHGSNILIAIFKTYCVYVNDERSVMFKC